MQSRAIVIIIPAPFSFKLLNEKNKPADHCVMLLIWIFYTAHPSCCFHSCVEVYHTNCLLSAGTTMTSQSFTVTLEPTKVTLNCCAHTYTRTSTMCLSALFICFSFARSLRPPLPLSHLSLPPSCGEADKELIYRPIKCRH